MTITEHAPRVLPEQVPASPWRRWLGPGAFAVFGLVDALVLGLYAHQGDATFAFSQPFAKVSVPNLSLPAAVTCYVCGGVTLALAVLRAFVPLGAFWRRACQLDPTLVGRDLWTDDEDDTPGEGMKALPAA